MLSPFEQVGGNVAPRLPGSWGLDGPYDYPSAAREIFSAAGFVEPVGCREIFHFDAASLRDSTSAAAQVGLFSARLV